MCWLKSTRRVCKYEPYSRVSFAVATNPVDVIRVRTGPAAHHVQRDGPTLLVGNFYDGLRKEVRDACFHGRLDGSECVITFQAMQTQAADFLANPLRIVARTHEECATIGTIAGYLLGQPGVHSIYTFWTRGHAKAKKQC